MSESRRRSSGRAVVLGASSGVGRAAASRLARDGWSTVLSSRGARDLEAMSADLEARYGGLHETAPIDLLADDDALGAYAGHVTSDGLDVAIITAGAIDADDDGLTDWSTIDRLTTANYTAVIKIAGRFLAHFEQQGCGTLVLFSSIAAAAPRSRNVAYAAAKSALASWATSQQHRLADTEIEVQVYSLGYVDTPMTAGQKLLFPKAKPEFVADRVVQNLGTSHRRGYLPKWWAPIVGTIRALPWTIYKRLRF
ncbi:MAG: SDR family NAD(P)-dependent oxidoreductase [Acidimicrobiales bacterium]|nr:SDR family NAD(P)-dependent oxidoreductase [Acidimicrobiales bacterium]